MTEATLKAVFTLDQSTFNPAGHNLTSEKAEQRASELEAQGKKVKVLDQPSRHRALTFKHCKACATAAQNLSPQQPSEGTAQEIDRQADAEASSDEN